MGGVVRFRGFKIFMMHYACLLVSRYKTYVQGYTRTCSNAEDVIHTASFKKSSERLTNSNIFALRNAEISFNLLKLSNTEHIASRIEFTLHIVWVYYLKWMISFQKKKKKLGAVLNLHLESILQDILFSQQQRWLWHCSELIVAFPLSLPLPEMHAAMSSDDVFGWKVCNKWQMWTFCQQRAVFSLLCPAGS